MKMQFVKKRALASLTALCLIISGLGFNSLSTSAAGSTSVSGNDVDVGTNEAGVHVNSVSGNDANAGTNEAVVYVNGVSGNDANAGTSADAALKTMGAAYARIPDNNTEFTIVVSGNVDVSGSGLSSTSSGSAIMFPAHSGEVVITSKIGEADYTNAASLSFGGKVYILQGATTFEHINISSYADRMHANFYNLTFGEGITGSSTYYPAKTVTLGYWSTAGSYNKDNDSVFVMNSGKLGTYYAGTFYYDTDYSKMSTIINGGSIGTVYGTGITNSKEQSNVEITINGGTITNCYGVSKGAKVGSGGVTITLHKDATVTAVSAVETAGNSAGTLSGSAALNLVGYDAGAQLPTTISGFTNLGLSGSSVGSVTPWEGLTAVNMTDNSSMTLGAVPTENISVTVQKSGENWNTDTALLTAPVGAEEKITLQAAAEDSFTDYEFKSQTDDANVTWAIKSKDAGGTGEGDGGEGSTNEAVVYVNGVSGNDANAGTSAGAALKTMGAAYAKIPTDNTKFTIVVSGNVDVSDSGLSSTSNGATIVFPAHSGEVVITSKIGEADYTGEASLSFAGKVYKLQGATTFEHIKISGYADRIHANFYNLTLGEGITGSSTYYPANTVTLGYWSTNESYNKDNDSVFVMNSGKLGTYYAGTFYYDTDYSKMSTIINGGSIGTVYGTGLTNSKEQSKVEITINGGTIGNCYGASNKTKVGDVTITLHKDAKVTAVSAVQPASGSNTATLSGSAALNLVGYDETAQLPTTISDFDCLELTNSSITVGEALASMWDKVEKVTMTDNSSLKLDVTLTKSIEVAAEKSGSDWNTQSALITAPAATAENVFTLLTPVGYEFAYASDTAATWTLKKGEIKIGQVTNESGQSLNIDMKLPDGVAYTPLAESASAYDFYQARLNDLTASGVGREVPVIEPVEIKAQVEIYVDPINGNDDNRGSLEAPYKTIQKALKGVEMLQTSEEPCAGIVVYLRGGNYITSETITLGKEHSGKNGIPVIISAYGDEEVIISGGTSIAGGAFGTAKSLSETAYEKLPVAVRDRIVAVDLTQYGISTDDFAITGDGPNYQVFVDGEELTLSRYPNTKKLALTGEVLHIGYVSATYSDWPAGTNQDDPDIRFEMTDMRPTLWENDGHIWLNGSVYAEWEINNIRVKEANISTGVMRLDGGSRLGAKSSPSNRYYYYNILEELDVPGEYYIDKATGIMYMYPIGDMNGATVTFSAMAKDLINLSEAENVVINGLTIENGAGYGINMTDCEQVVVQNCTLRNLGDGIRIQGKKSGIIYSDIYNIANKPARISIDQKFMDYVPEQNFVQNRYIHNAGTKNVKKCEIYVQGTGNVVSHNLLQGMYGVAIYFTNAKDCIVEYNEITGAPSGINDYGAIYNPYHPSNTGNHIRYNYIHDIGLFSEKGNPQAIYLDEGLSGNFVYGNIMSNVPRGFFTNSGSNNVIVNNIVQDGREGSTYSIRGEDNFKNFTIEERFTRAPILKRMYETYIGLSAENQAELKKRDPLQARLYETIKEALAAGSDGKGMFASHGNYAHDNLIFDHGEVGFLGINHDIGGNTIAAANPFVNVDEHNFTLTDSTMIAWADKLPSMDRIGVVTNNKQAISSFSMYAPYNGEQKADPFAVLLKWTCSGGADGYTVEISKNADMSEAKMYDVTNRYYFFDRDEYFTYDQTYYWRVTAYTVAESRQATKVGANNGQVYSFKTMTMDDYLALNPLNTEALEETIGLAEDLAGQIKEISEGGLYYDGTVETLHEAISAAKEVMSSLSEQDQVSVNTADAALQDAVNAAKASKAIQYVTFENIDAAEWEDKANSRVITTAVGDELQMSIASGSRAEAVYEVGINTREILCFRYKLDTKSTWNGFAMAQTIPSAFITAVTDGYFICINPNQVELQKYQGGKKVIQINKPIDDTIFNGGEYYDVEIGTINQADGSVAIHFKINDTVIFDMSEYVDTVDDEIIPGSPIAGYETFGVVVNPANGTTYMMKADLTAKKTADYSALDAEIAQKPEDGEAYTAETWEAYQGILESAESMTRNLTVHEQSVVDGYAEALKAAREALVKKPAGEQESPSPSPEASPSPSPETSPSPSPEASPSPSPEASPSPSPTPTPVPPTSTIVVKPGSSLEEAVNTILQSIESAENGENIFIDLQGADRDSAKLPTTILEKLHEQSGNRSDIQLALGNGFSWHIQSDSIDIGALAALGEAFDIWAEVTEDVIPKELLNEATKGDKQAVEVTLRHNGAFGFQVNLGIPLGKASAGRNASLFYFNPNTNALESRGTAVIDENGIATYLFTRASDYVVIIEADATKPDTKPEQTKPSEETKEDIPTNIPEESAAQNTDVSVPSTGDNSHLGLWISFAAVALLALAALAWIKLRKQR